MKNVVVLYYHNLSADYLAGEPLKDKFGMAPNFDSCEILESGDAAYRAERMQNLQTADGIQFHHFKHVYPQEPEFKDSRNAIEPWIDRLESFLKAKGESIDGLVIPHGSREGETAVAWVKDLKQRFPNLKVLVTDPNLFSIDTDPNAKPGYESRQRTARYAVPETEEAAITNMIRKATIRKGDPGYSLAEGVDMVTKNQGCFVVSNALRELLGMERLKQPARER